MPTDEELERVAPMIKDLTNDDFAALKAGKKTYSELADSVLGYVGDAESEAAKYSLIQTAFKNYMSDYAADKAIKSFDMLSAHVKKVPPGTFGKWCVPHAAHFAKNGRAAELAALLDKSVDAGDVESTTALMNALKLYMRKLGAGVRNSTEPFALAANRANRQIRRKRDLETLYANVRKRPGDVAAHEEYALSLAALGDWKTALNEFAMVGGPVSAAAKWERKWPRAVGAGWTPAQSAELWWDRAETLKDNDVAAALRGRSVEWYRIAIEKGELAGLRKTLAEKRLRKAEELGGSFARVSLSLPASPGSQPKREAAGKDSGKVSAAAPAKGASWDLPKAFDVPNERVLDLGGGVQVPFCAYPPGSFTMVKHKVTITRPFWISKTMLTLNQLVAIPDWKDLFKDKGYAEAGEKVSQQLKDSFVGVALRRKSMSMIMERLNAKFKDILPPGHVFRLPSEAEFYYAYCSTKDDDNYPHNADNIDANSGEALSGAGFVPKADKWKWDSLPLNYRWMKFAKLPKANEFGFVCYRGMGTGYQLLDMLDVDLGGKWNKLSKNDEEIQEMVKYEGDEVDPLRMSGDLGLCGAGGYAPRARYVSRDGAGFILFVVGPDLVSEKKK